MSAGALATPPAPRDDAGIIRSGPAVAAKRRSNAGTIGIPTVGAAAALAVAGDVTPTTIALFAVFFFAGALGIGIGLHRYWAHRAFRTGTPLRLALGVLASWAWQGPIAVWVADHRRHHANADGPLDPHSPHWIGGRRAGSRARGLLHAHLGWMLFGDVSDPRRYAGDVVRDPISGWCSRFYWPLAVSSLLLPALVGWAIGGVNEAWLGFLWAGCLRVALLQHVTWAIASVGHSYGERLPGSKDEARNTTLLAVLLFGEGLHSYHHLAPSAGVNEPAQLDLGGAILRLWERWGWIEDLKRGA